MPGYGDDSQQLFKQKQYFIYSVFNKVMQSDMGRTIVSSMHQLQMHNPYGGILRLTCLHHVKD